MVYKTFKNQARYDATISALAATAGCSCTCELLYKNSATLTIGVEDCGPTFQLHSKVPRTRLWQHLLSEHGVVACPKTQMYHLSNAGLCQRSSGELVLIDLGHAATAVRCEP